MKIPSEIKILAHTIIVRKKLPVDVNNRGAYDNRSQIITLEHDYDLPESQQAEVFMHEILEAIKAMHNNTMPHETLTLFSEQLFAIIRNNKLDFLNTEYEFKKGVKQNGKRKDS